MPHGSDGGDDFASTDEVKVYKEEGDEENKSSAENLSEEKLGLLTETEQGKGLTHSSVGICCNISDSQFGFGGCLADYYSFHGRIPFGYPSLLNPYPYAAGSAISGLNNVSILPPRTWFYMYNNASGSQPYMGLPPPPPPVPPPSLQIGPHTGYSPGSSMYHLAGASPSHQLSHLFIQNDFSPISCFDQFSRGNPSLYPNPFGSSYLPSVMSGPSLSRLNPGSFFSSQPPQPHHHYHHHSPAVASASPPSCPKLPCPGMSRPVLVSTGIEDARPSRQSVTDTSRQRVWFPLGHSSESSKCKWSAADKPTSSNRPSSSRHSLRRMHVKKPLNAFMLFMKEMRSKVIDECTLKESAAINQILGRKWHSLDQSEQNKYYEMARKEKLLHRQMFPGWSARDNYATQARKKRKLEQINQVNHRLALREDERDASVSKKCRARYGLDHQNRWCKPCRRKKRCIRFLDDDNDAGDIQESISSSSSQVTPAADSTVNESQLLSKRSSTSESDCLLSELEAPHSCQSISARGQSHIQCDEELSTNCQFYPNKSFVSSWSDGTCSSTCSPSLPFLNRMKSFGSNQQMISSTTCLSNS